MPTVDYNEDIEGMTVFKSQFIGLREKGDKIKFKIVDKAFYVGKHWIGEKQTVNCSRVATGDKNEPCEWCEKAEQGLENPYHRSKKYDYGLQFYYPIVTREFNGKKIGEGAIFQTSQLVHNRIKEEAAAGIDIYKSDWMVTRNEGKPASYYSVIRLDPVPLSVEEQKEAKQIKEDFEKLKPSLEGKESKMAPPAEEEIPLGEEAPGESAKGGGDLLDDLPF